MSSSSSKRSSADDVGTNGDRDCVDDTNSSRSVTTLKKKSKYSSTSIVVTPPTPPIKFATGSSSSSRKDGTTSSSSRGKRRRLFSNPWDAERQEYQGEESNVLMEHPKNDHHGSSSSNQEGKDDDDGDNDGRRLFQSDEESSEDDNKLSEEDEEEQPIVSLSQESAATQPVDYEPDLTVKRQPRKCFAKKRTCIALLEDCYDESNVTRIYSDQQTICIGRDSHQNDIVIPNKKVSRKHCELSLDVTQQGLAVGCFLKCLSTNGCCHLLPSGDGYEWKTLRSSDGMRKLSDGQPFRLLPPGGNDDELSGVEFKLHLIPTLGGLDPRPGSNSFDVQFLSLLEDISRVKHESKNKKGPNWTLPDSRTFAITLRGNHQDGDNNRFFLPLTSLRHLSPRNIIYEAMWYLRGEDDIKFLQDHGCRFWDAQADENGKIGLNYGLLTRFPHRKENGEIFSINQLDNVIKKLSVHGSSSRNLTITLHKPDEPTAQAACTSSVQFTVSKDENGEYLDLTVNQRSSDVIVGLPHDVVVWSIILHLVRWDVKRRSGRNLREGCLSFIIGRNAAHVYKLNEETMKELLKRTPKENCQPYFVINEDLIGHGQNIFDLAMNYQREMFRVEGYGNDAKHPALRVEVATETK